MADTETEAQEQPTGMDQTSINTGPAIPVSLDKIESQIRELWRNVANAAYTRGSGAGQSVTMAQVLNLLVMSGSHDEANEYIGDTEKITGRHPCRVIAMVEDPKGADEPVQAWVSMYCQVPPAGGRQVCCEQVAIVSSGNALRQVPAAVLPLLISDLPVFLWWPSGAPFDDYIFRQLADSIDRLILDSSTFENPEGILSRIATMLRTNWAHIAGTDMNWGRLTYWREIIAGFFDPPTLRPYLDQINKVTIEYAMPAGSGPVNRAQAYMIAGWLASRLGWQPTDVAQRLVHSRDQLPPTVHLLLRGGKRTINVEIAPKAHKAVVSGNICSLRLEVFGAQGGTGQREACFEMSLAGDAAEPGTAWTNVEIAGIEPTNRNIHMDELSRADLLDQELEVYSHDHVYEEAMHMVGTFIRGYNAARNNEAPRKASQGEPMSAAQTPRMRPRGIPPR